MEWAEEGRKLSNDFLHTDWRCCLVQQWSKLNGPWFFSTWFPNFCYLAARPGNGSWIVMSVEDPKGKINLPRPGRLGQLSRVCTRHPIGRCPTASLGSRHQAQLHQDHPLPRQKLIPKDEESRRHVPPPMKCSPCNLSIQIYSKYK